MAPIKKKTYKCMVKVTCVRTGIVKKIPKYKKVASSGERKKVGLCEDNFWGDGHRLSASAFSAASSDLGTATFDESQKPLSQ